MHVQSWQSWAELEEAEGAFTRAQELRSFRLQEWNEVVLPGGFGAGLDALRGQPAPPQSGPSRPSLTRCALPLPVAACMHGCYSLHAGMHACLHVLRRPNEPPRDHRLRLLACP